MLGREPPEGNCEGRPVPTLGREPPAGNCEGRPVLTLGREPTLGLLFDGWLKEGERLIPPEEPPRFMPPPE